jgi:hypothetical protein
MERVFTQALFEPFIHDQEYASIWRVSQRSGCKTLEEHPWTFTREGHHGLGNSTVRVVTALSPYQVIN